MNNFLDREFRTFCIQEFELLRQKAKKRKKPEDIYDKLELELDRMFEGFYKNLLTTFS